MKDKIFRFIGEAFYVILKGVVLILIIFIVSGIMVQQEKDEIWMEVVESFQIQYDTKEAELYNRFGIVDEDEVDQWNYQFKTYNISFNSDTSEAPTPNAETKPEALAEIEELCGEQSLPDSDEYEVCVKDQLDAMAVMFFAYMKEIEKMDETNPAKIILQIVIVDCTFSNRTDSGIVDNRKALTCVQESIREMNKQLGEELETLKYKKGI
jgi:hypothetical protein